MGHASSGRLQGSLSGAEWCLWSCSRQCLRALKCLNVLGTQERWDACQMLMSRQRDLLSQAELISETCRNRFSAAIRSLYVMTWSFFLRPSLYSDIWPFCQQHSRTYSPQLDQVIAKLKDELWRHRKKLQEAEVRASTRVYEDKSIIGGVWVVTTWP